MPPAIVLITGANRGIGKGLLGLFLAKPNHTVIAANRDPDHSSSKDLANLPKAEGTSLFIVKSDATVATDPINAVKQLSTYGINHIDIIIANAGIALLWPKVCEVNIEDVATHMETNVYGFIRLYQATIPLLKKSKTPLWVTIGSTAGFLSEMAPIPNAAYAPSKVVQHWYTKAIHFEEPTLIAFPIDPGWVQTEPGNRHAKLFGIEKASVTIEESVKGMLKIIDGATRETHSGKLWVFDGRQVPW